MEQPLNSHHLDGRLESMRDQFQHLEQAFALGLEANPDALPAASSPVFSVQVGPVPVYASLHDFAPALSPESWSKFASGITIQVRERGTEQPTGWSGVIEELLAPIPGDGPLAQLLTLRNQLNVEVLDRPTPKGELAYVNFSLRKSLDGVLTKDQGYLRAAAWHPMLLNWTHISAKKQLQLAKAPPDWFAAIIPGLLRQILRFWLWEYSIRFLLDAPESPKALAADEPLNWMFAHAFDSFEAEFQAASASAIRHCERQAQRESECDSGSSR